jgi:hypothetical protein
MPIPLGVYVAVSLGIGTGGVAAYLAKEADGTVEEVTKDVFDQLVEEGVPLLEELAGSLGALSLSFVEGLGEAVVKGVDRTYDYVREKFIKGKEPDIIAGFTIGMLTLLTGVYVWHSVKNARDAL